MRYDCKSKEHAVAACEDWTCDIAPLCWSPDPVVALPLNAERLAPEREEFARRFGLRIGPAR